MEMPSVKISFRHVKLYALFVVPACGVVCDVSCVAHCHIAAWCAVGHRTHYTCVYNKLDTLIKNCHFVLPPTQRQCAINTFTILGRNTLVFATGLRWGCENTGFW